MMKTTVAMAMTMTLIMMTTTMMLLLMVVAAVSYFWPFCRHGGVSFLKHRK